ncbi:MAG TPA: hypothetical protein VMJ64_08700 [Anaerolineales bacterium]|nr:hypothetical protein [Anaerolineales bacterium]
MKLAARNFSLILLAALLAACSPAAHPADNGLAVQQLAATMAAATISAGITATAVAASPTAAPLSPDSQTGAPTAQALLFINTDNAACRSGPGTDFKVIANYPAGTSVDLAGQDTADNYWIVLDPASKDLCWVSIQDATPTGDYQSLPQVTPPAVSVSVPGKPSRGAWNFSCDNTTLTTILAWNVSNGGAPNGFRIYREGSQIADVPATQTTYTDKTPFTYGSSIAYAVAAYNDAGLSQQVTWNFHCP